MTEYLLEAQPRKEHGRTVKKLRRGGLIPSVLYGHETKTQSLSVPSLAFQKVWHVAGESSLIDMHIGNEPPVKVIIQDVQFDPLTGNVLHVDFHQVNMKEKVDVRVELHFVGESPAVKELGGTLVKDRNSIEVECLPQDLVKEIVVDIGAMKVFEDVIRMKELSLPKGLTLKGGVEDQVAHVEAPRTEAELAELDTAVEEDVTKVEKIEKPKEEEAAEEAAPSPAPENTQRSH